MNKLFKHVASLTLGLTMAIGVGITANVSKTIQGAKAAGEPLATFSMGTNGSAGHKDNNTAKTTYSEEDGDYTLNITGGTKMYPSSLDAMGNGCIKFGTGSAAGSMEFTVPDGVTAVVLHIGGYKATAAKFSINNGSSQTTTKLSNNGQYDAVEVDTSSNKTVTFATVSGGYRAMLNTIVFYGDTSSSTPTDSVSLDKQILNLEVGQSETLVATASGTVTWSSSSPSIATVDDGVVTAVGSGKATITATCGEASAMCEVTVSEPINLDNVLVSHEMNSFTATSADVSGTNGLVRYSTAKNKGTSDPAINDGEIRLYQNEKGEDGGSITVSTESPNKIVQVIIGSAMGTTVDYLIDGDKTTGISIAANNKITIAASNGANSIQIICKGTTKTTRLYVNYLQVSYSTGGVELTDLAVSGTMTKTSYTTAESWSTDGLTVNGTYSNEDTDDVTSKCSFKFYNSNDVEVSSPKDLGVSENQTLKVTATLGDVVSEKHIASNAITVTQALEYTLVTDPTQLTSGTTFILVGGTTPKAMLQEKTVADSASKITDVTLSNNFETGSVATSANATIFTLGGSTGAWTIKNGDNQLGFTGAENNYMRFNEEMTDSFNITLSDEGENKLSFESKAYSGRYLQYNNGSPRFSNYSGQMDIYMFAIIAEVTYGTTDHVSISSLPETEFYVGSTFNADNLTLVAWDGADESTANSKLVQEFTTSIDKGTVFTDSDIGEHTVTVSYTEGNTFTDTYQIYVFASATYELVTEAPSDWSGTYLIVDTISDVSYAMKSSLENIDVPSNHSVVTPLENTITAGQHLQFTIASMDGGYSIQTQTGKYIGWNKNDENGLNMYDEPFANVISYDSESSDTKIMSPAGTKGLGTYESNGEIRFRFYSTAGVQLYKLVQSTAVTEFATTFMDFLSTGDSKICDDNGNTNLDDLKTAWALLAEEYNTLSVTDKEIFKQGDASQTGDIVSQALALYDHIVAVYGERLESDDCNEFNFMDRVVQPLPSSSMLIANTNNSTVIPLMVIITIVSFAFLSFYVSKKRKVNSK